MALFDKGFPLPQVGGASGFTLPGPATKMSETISTTFKTLGSTGPFSKLSANLPSIESQWSSAVLSGNSMLADGMEQLLNYKVSELQDDFLAQASASELKASATGAKPVTADHLVSLSDGTVTVEFDVMPEVTENHTVEYEAVAPAQSPGAFQKYKGTSSTTWMLQVTLISRTSAEATANFYRLWTLRGWTKPFFGETTGQFFQGRLGAPPPVLTLKGLRGLYGPVPVVITSLNFVWPRDVDYLPTNVRGTLIGGEDDNFVPFPVLLTLPIGLTESFSTTQFNQFNLADYRKGNMKSAYNIPVVDYSNENYDSRRYGPESRTLTEAERLADENYDSRQYHLYYGADIRGVVAQGATAATLPRRLAQDAKNAREEGLKMLAEASRRAKGGF